MEQIQIKLKSYDAKLIDAAAAKLIEVVKVEGASFFGPVPLPTHRELFTILRSPHVNKTSRLQYELKTHKRLIGIINPQPVVMEKLNRIELPSGVEIKIK